MSMRIDDGGRPARTDGPQENQGAPQNDSAAQEAAQRAAEEAQRAAEEARRQAEEAQRAAEEARRQTETARQRAAKAEQRARAQPTPENQTAAKQAQEQARQATTREQRAEQGARQAQQKAQGAVAQANAQARAAGRAEPFPVRNTLMKSGFEFSREASRRMLTGETPAPLPSAPPRASAALSSQAPGRTPSLEEASAELQDKLNVGQQRMDPKLAAQLGAMKGSATFKGAPVDGLPVFFRNYSAPGGDPTRPDAQLYTSLRKNPDGKEEWRTFEVVGTFDHAYNELFPGRAGTNSELGLPTSGREVMKEGPYAGKPFQNFQNGALVEVEPGRIQRLDSSGRPVGEPWKDPKPVDLNTAVKVPPPGQETGSLGGVVGPTGVNRVQGKDLSADDIRKIIGGAEKARGADFSPLNDGDMPEYIVAVSKETGVPAWLLLGQAQNETSFGSGTRDGQRPPAEVNNVTVSDGQPLYDSKGRPAGTGNANNLFNIRPGTNWTGSHIETGKGGAFRAYKDFKESIRDYANLMASSYKGLTLEQAVKKYYPAGDGDNRPEQYIQSLTSFASRNGIPVSRDSVPIGPNAQPTNITSAGPASGASGPQASGATGAVNTSYAIPGAEQAIAYAQNPPPNPSKDSGGDWHYWCLGLVNHAYQSADRPIANLSKATAHDSYQAYADQGQIHQEYPPPRGAIVFYDWKSNGQNIGHVGISLGDGQYVSTATSGAPTHVANVKSPTYLGWAYPTAADAKAATQASSAPSSASAALSNAVGAAASAVNTIAQGASSQTPVGAGAKNTSARLETKQTLAPTQSLDLGGIQPAAAYSLDSLQTATNTYTALDKQLNDLQTQLSEQTADLNASLTEEQLKAYSEEFAAAHGINDLKQQRDAAAKDLASQLSAPGLKEAMAQGGDVGYEHADAAEKGLQLLAGSTQGLAALSIYNDLQDTRLSPRESFADYAGKDLEKPFAQAAPTAMTQLMTRNNGDQSQSLKEFMPLVTALKGMGGIKQGVQFLQTFGTMTPEQMPALREVIKSMNTPLSQGLAAAGLVANLWSADKDASHGDFLKLSKDLASLGSGGANISLLIFKGAANATLDKSAVALAKLAPGLGAIASGLSAADKFLHADGIPGAYLSAVGDVISAVGSAVDATVIGAPVGLLIQGAGALVAALGDAFGGAQKKSQELDTGQREILERLTHRTGIDGKQLLDPSLVEGITQSDNTQAIKLLRSAHVSTTQLQQLLHDYPGVADSEQMVFMGKVAQTMNIQGDDFMKLVKAIAQDAGGSQGLMGEIELLWNNGLSSTVHGAHGTDAFTGDLKDEDTRALAPFFQNVLKADLANGPAGRDFFANFRPPSYSRN